MTTVTHLVHICTVKVQLVTIRPHKQEVQHVTSISTSDRSGERH